MSHNWHALERQIILGDRGRVVLPSEIRTQLGLDTGSRLLLRTEADGSLRLRPYRSVADQSRGLLTGLAPTGESIVDELLVERRQEAEDESAE
jgi:AbrB family looped-hinge helix DNA binding protein